MKKNSFWGWDRNDYSNLSKVYRIMKLTVFMMLIGVLNIFASTAYSQDAKVTVRLNGSTVKQVLKEIENKTEFTFLYNDELIDVNRKVNLDVKDQAVSEVLDQLFKSSGVIYRVVDQRIILTTPPQVSPVNRQQQTLIISGVVNDDKGEPLPGVNVFEKSNMTSGVITGVDGTYTITISSDDAVLTYSFIGFDSQDIQVAGRASINITMVEEMKGLDEVVVVGYGSQTRSKMTSAISTVKTEDLKQAAVANLENALGGRMSGVFARQNSGEPGYDGADIKIRGFGAALIVVDGVPGRDYSHLDANEIESISVLKDAASCAVYGMQGANGVILVTTKKGSNTTPTIEVNSYLGFQTPTRYPDSMTGLDYQNMNNIFRANNQLLNDPNAIMAEQDMEIDSSLPNTNWSEEAIRDYAPMNTTNVNISGGNEFVKYFFSTGYLKQEGIWTANSTSKERYNIRSNMDFKVTDNLKMTAGIGGIFTQLDHPGAGQHDIGQNVIFTPPTYGSVNDMGYEFIPVKSLFNPLALMDPDAVGYSDDKQREWNINLSAEYQIPFIEGLSVKGVMGYDTWDNQKKNWNKKITFYNEVDGEFNEFVSSDGYNKTTLALEDNSNYNLTLQGFLKYVKSFENHNFNASLIYEETRGNSHGFNTGRDTYTTDLVDNISAGMDDDKKWNNEWQRTFATQSYIGRLAYDFDTKYLVEFVGRYDGAQYFAPDNRWGFFPAVSAGWVISKESFMEPLKGVISELKLRASWGQMGDMSDAKDFYTRSIDSNKPWEGGEDYYWKAGYKYPGNVLQLGEDKFYTLAERLVPNPDFTWSTSTTYNIGLDAKLWRNKLGVTAEVFYRERTDLPAKKADDNAGNLSTYYNLNADNTRGFEIALDHQNSINELRYNVSANLSWARSQYGYTEHGAYTSGYSEWRYGAEGNWVNSMWGQTVTGRYQNEDEIFYGDYLVGQNKNKIFPGDVIYEDWNGDGYIDGKDEHIIGRSNNDDDATNDSYPELIYGLTASLEWKGIDFTMFWQGSGKTEYVLWGSSSNPFKMDTPDRGTFEFLGDYWHKADYTNGESGWVAGEYPTYRNGYDDINSYGGANTFWKRDGSYVRLKNLELGYTLPKHFTEKVKIKSARFYVSGVNLLTFSSFKYIDPETGGSQEISNYPQMKSYNVGVNLKF